ncbi:MAG: hypothetical protein QNJ74_12460 [Trichodesmium sp. MO_231.B1]|nr:hypothetical protein [Trichodesmium sp. MO_231.B1]
MKQNNDNDKWYDQKPLSLKGLVYITHTKPIGAYLKYIKNYSIPEGIEQSRTFTKKKGYRLGAEYSLEVSATIGANIKAIEASGTVTHSFTFTAEMEVEQEESFSETVTGPVELRLYQPVLLYVTVVEGNQLIKDHLRINNIPFVERGGSIYFTRGVYQNEPYLFEEEDWLETVVDEREFSDRLSVEDCAEWHTEVEYQGCGKIYDVKSKLYFRGDYNIEGVDDKAKADDFCLTGSGRLYCIRNAEQYVCFQGNVFRDDGYQKRMEIFL